MMKRYAGVILLGAAMGFGATEAQATPITFSTTGVFSASGNNIDTISNANGTTILTFNGAASAMVNTPAGANFGDIVVTSTVPLNLAGPALTGTFALSFNQVSPAGSGTLIGTLSGTLGSNIGIATLTFPTTSLIISGFTYTVNQIYTIALPMTGGGGGAGLGTTTLQGTIDGPASVPDNGDTLVLLGAALLGLVVVQRRLRSA